MNKNIKKIAGVLMSIEVLGVTFLPVAFAMSSHKEKQVKQFEDVLVKRGVHPKRFANIQPGYAGSTRGLDTLRDIRDSLDNRHLDSLNLISQKKIPTRQVLDSMQNHYKEVKFPPLY